MGVFFGNKKKKKKKKSLISNVVLLYSIGNYIQSLVMEHNGRYYKKKNIYIYVCVCVYMYKNVYILICIMCNICIGMSIYIYLKLGHFVIQQKLTEYCKSSIIKNFKKRRGATHKQKKSVCFLYLIFLNSFIEA